MQEYFLKERGIAYRTNTFLPGRKTLVFVHGLSGSASAWFAFEKRFAETCNIVTYDLRGHGWSKKYPRHEDYMLTYFADDLSALLLHLNIQRCTFIAHSMGTTVALLFLLKYPDVAESALFLAPDYRVHSLLRTRITRPFISFGILLLRHFPLHPKLGHRLDYSNFGYSPDWSLKRIVPEIRDLGVRLYMYCLYQIYASTEDALWKKAPLPVMLVHGTRDSFVPFAHAIRLQKEMQNAQLVPIDGANHMLVLNNVAEIVRVIEDFIK